MILSLVLNIVQHCTNIVPVFQTLKMEFLADISGEFTVGVDKAEKTSKKKKKKKSSPSPPPPPDPVLEANLAEANLTVPPLVEWPPSQDL